MTIRNLTLLTAPKSIALIGASPQPGSVGLTVTRNLLAGGFGGCISLINPKYSEIEGRRCYGSVNDLAEPPDLAVIATPAPIVPALIGELGCKGTRAAIVLTAGLGSRLLQMLDARSPVSDPHLPRPTIRRKGPSLGGPAR